MSVQLFSTERIRAALQTTVPGLAIEAVAETGSTNADLLARLEQLRAPLLLVAQQQTAGRGRAGRAWHAVPGDSLTFSLAWRFSLPLQGLVGLPLAVGVALAEALATGGVAVQLKWPNDVLCEGRKLAGILIETAQTAQGLWAVVGIGVNLRASPGLAAQVDQPIAALSQLVPTFDRDLLLASILDRLCLALQEFEESGLAAFTARWNALHGHRGQQVQIADRGQTIIDGIARGIDDQGRLLLDTAQGRCAVLAGDVCLRLAKV